jgi:hypothetical protein
MGSALNRGFLIRRVDNAKRITFAKNLNALALAGSIIRERLLSNARPNGASC